MNPTETKKTTEPTGATTSTVVKDEGDGAAAEPVGTDATSETQALDGETEGAETEDAEDSPRASSGIAAAAAAVVAAGLGVVALSGTWVGKVAAERQTLIGQIKTSQGGTPAQQIAAVYGDAWHTTALVNGVFALLALIVGVAVLAVPQKAGWVRAFAVAGVALGVLGMIVSAGMYFDLLLSLPTTGS
ncbi:hypothetical protein [Streptomyces sp. NBC_00191]|uniref:hypothetical protein n=1 Tax=Streptomyces sp. NBC_00191 TaxID=2975674 RepID=UPI00386B8A56